MEDTTCVCIECSPEIKVRRLRWASRKRWMKCDGRCVFPQDLIDGHYSTDPVYPDPKCSKHGWWDDTCDCPHHSVQSFLIERLVQEYEAGWGSKTPRERWGTCCPNDPACEHSFMEADELARYLDTPIP